MSIEQQIIINQLNSEITKYHKIIWMLLEKLSKLNNDLKQLKSKMILENNEKEKLYNKYKIIRNKYLNEHDEKLNKKLGQEMKLSGCRHTIKCNKIIKQKQILKELQQKIKSLEKEINKIEIILNQKLDQTIIGANFNLIKDCVNNTNINNLADINVIDNVNSPTI